MCQNQCSCQIEYPHSHLVEGKTCECEKGREGMVIVGGDPLKMVAPRMGKLKGVYQPVSSGSVAFYPIFI